uniref:Uncharacterized protein n=1 Tax=Arundo donax TaxID=35708 RepID=A0A0A9BSN9_ARUDO
MSCSSPTKDNVVGYGVSLNWSLVRTVMWYLTMGV